MQILIYDVEIFCLHEEQIRNPNADIETMQIMRILMLPTS
jgi:hypothetical protein